MLSSPTFDTLPRETMTLPYAHTTYRTVSVSSDQPRTVIPVSPVGGNVQFVNGTVDSSAVYGNMRYLVPVQRAESYMLVNQSPQVISQVVPQMVSPVYLQNVQRVSVSSLEDSDSVFRQQTEIVNGKASSVVSNTFSPPKSPEPSPVEVDIVDSVVKKETVVTAAPPPVKIELPKVELTEVEPLAKLDTRFFGELLAEVYRKNCDIHTCISEHVAKIRGRKHLLDSSNDYKVEKEEVEALIPKGVSELTKQQIRYLLQTRQTSDKTMRLLLSTFSSLREELIHLQEDLTRLESEKEELEKDLSFKADQAQQYDRLLETVRENNRQLQVSLKESAAAQRSLETQMFTSRSTDSNKDFRLKELEGSKRALEQENEMLRQKLAGQGQSSSASLQAKTDELARQYKQMLDSLREEKDKELKSMRSQLIKIQTERTTVHTNDNSLQLRITELLTTLETRETLIKRQEEEIRRLQLERSNSSKSTSQTIVTKRYQTQYPILGLLSDDYQYTSPVKEEKTIVFKSSMR